MLIAAGPSTLSVVLTILSIVLSLVLMFVVLIQRGKGGGLAGAFGGVGGSSPFGSRAGDAFTKFTLYLAGVWILVIMIGVVVAKQDITSRSITPVEVPLPNDLTTE